MSWWLSADHRLDVVLDRRDAADAEVLDENLGDIRGEESRQRRSEVDVLDAEVQQGQQDDDGLLLVPSDVEDKRQLVDVIKTEDFLELERDQREAVGVVALASIEDARMPPMSPRFILMYLYFAQPAVKMTVSFGRALANSA